MNSELTSRPAGEVKVLMADAFPADRQSLVLLLSGLPGVSLVGITDNLIEALHWLGERRPHLLLIGRSLVGHRAPEVLAAVLRNEDAPHVLFYRDSRAAGQARGGEPAAEIPAASDVASIVAAIVRAKTVTLSPRERDVLRLVALGYSSRETAARLHLSVRTVENHRARIARRTGLKSVAQLTLHAVQLGLMKQPAADVSDTPLGSQAG